MDAPTTTDMAGKEVCPACGGSGQVSTFQGVSRFLLTVEECPLCLGTGQVQRDSDEAVPEE